MARRGRPPKHKGLTIKSKETQVFIGFLFLSAGIALIFNNTLAGAIPRMLYSFLGVNTYLLGIFLLSLGFNLIGLKNIFSKKRLIGESVLIAALAPLVAIVRSATSAGLLGRVLHSFLYDMLGGGLEIAVLFTLILIGVSLVSGVSLSQIASFIQVSTKFTLDAIAYLARFLVRFVVGAINLGKKILTRKASSVSEEEAVIEIKTATTVETEKTKKLEPESSHIQAKEEKVDTEALPSEEVELPDVTEEKEPQIKVNFGTDLLSAGSKQEAEAPVSQYSELEQRFMELYSPKFEQWEFPSLEIFEPPTPDSIDKREIQQKSKVIEETLASFRVQAKVTRIVIGPTVVQYALNLATGTKVAKVKNLAKDIALALAAPSDSIRVDTIAGTNLVGIEVPRRKPHIVRIREILASEELDRNKKRLPLAIGKGIQGDVVVLDLANMPHLLVAGATGTGKSVTLNDIITGFLMNFTPDELRLILVDPKMVEMELYNDLPHLLVPVITEMDKVVSALDWLISEMELRYRLFKQKHVRNIDEFNALGEFKIPYIVLIIDEMADLILTKRAEVEQKIVRLAQLARATGIHLILATQRPSVNVITGLIKANIPARIALGVTSNVDSRVIIDQSGAENLLGKGDMLIKTPNSVKLKRVQGAYVSTKEIEKLASAIKEYVFKVYEEPKTFYVEEVVNQQPEVMGPGSGEGYEKDPLLREAIRLVVEQQKVSASALQRYLRIGFNRAARLIEQMEALGVVSPRIGNRREVLISSPDEVKI